MTTWSAIISKFALTLLFAVIAFAWVAGGNPWSWIIGLALAATALNYLLGDLAILPATGNLIASIADGGLAVLTAYIFSLISDAFQATPASLLTFAVLVAVGEFFFHLYLRRNPKVSP